MASASFARIDPVIAPLATLLAFQLAGEALAFGLALPIPGPVIGMALLLAALALRPALRDTLRPTASALLQHLSLLFVPAGVGVMVHGRRLADEGVAIAVALVISTVFALAAGLAVGVVVALVSAVLIAWLLGASPVTLASLAPKSVTTPVAMGISEKIGGLPSLTAVAVVATGIIGAALGRFVFDALRVRSWAARGFAIGLAAHGQGVARAFVVSEEAGAFAGLAMGLAALVTALAAPWLAPGLIAWLV